MLQKIKKNKQNTCCEEIVLSVHPTPLYLLGTDPENPAVVWKKLADQFQKKTLGEKTGSTKKVVQFGAERWTINAETC